MRGENAPRRERKGIAGSLALVVASVLLTLGAAELVVRAAAVATSPLDVDSIARAQSEAILDPSQWVEVGGFGFRDEGIEPGAFAPGAVRVLLLGDSFTEGAGVRDNADRFSNRVETRLDAELRRSGSDQRFHVFNAGKGGANPHQWVDFLEALLPVYRPQYVYAVFFLRDGTALATSVVHNRRIVDPIREKYAAWPLYERSRLLRTFYDRLAWREYTTWFTNALRDSYLGSPLEQSVWRWQAQHLVRLRRLCEEAGARFHLVIFPLLYGLDDYAFHDVEAEITDFAEGHGIPTHSLTPGFLGEDARRLWVSPYNQHPNEEGHRIAAETLLSYLRRTIPELSDGPPDGDALNPPPPPARP